MIAGLPGTGIGGLYYLLLACSMPLHRLWRARRGDRDREKERLIRRHLPLTFGIVAAMWVTGILLGVVLEAAAPGAAASAATRLGVLVPATPLAVALATLCAVYLFMRAVRLVASAWKR